MSRSYKDAVSGHSRRDQPLNKGGRMWATGWTTGFKRFAKRHNRRYQRRLNNPDPRDPVLIYPYLNMLNPHYVRGSYIILDFSEDYAEYWDDDHYTDNWLFYEMLMDDYDEPEFDDYDPWDYDYDYNYDY